MSCRDWIRSWLKFLPLFFVPALCHAQNIGSVRGWGDESGNKLNIPLDLTNAVAIAAGNLHSLAIRATGSVVGWGDNSDGQATPPSNLNDAVAVAAGSAHSVALRRNGTVIAWGANAANQTNVSVGLTGVRAIACGENFSVALRSNGTLIAWGDASLGKTAVPSGNTFIAIACGLNHALALRTDGAVLAWGGNNLFGERSVPAAALSGVARIAAGENFSIALRSDGLFVGWGNNFNHQLDVPAAAAGATAIFSGQNHTVALKPNGTGVCWGDNTFNQCAPPQNLSNVVAVATRFNHTLALVIDPPTITSQPLSQNLPAGANVTFTVGVSGSPPFSFQWRKNGTNISGATTATLFLNNVQPTNAGAYSVRITNNVGSITSAVAILTVQSVPIIALQPQSQSVGVGTNVMFSVTAEGSPPLRFQWYKNGSALAGATTNSYKINSTQTGDAGSYFVVVTNSFGTVTSAVANLVVTPGASIIEQPQTQSALLGASVTFRVKAPAATSYQWFRNGTNLIGATNSFFPIHNAALTDQGNYSVEVANAFGSALSQSATLTVTQSTAFSSVVGWGQETLVLDTIFVSLVPPNGISDATAIAAGPNHSLALRAGGSVVGWGDNTFGQAGLPPNLSGVTAIAAGGHHTLVITNQGRVAAWGLNAFGQASPPELSNVVAIAAGANHSLAVKDDGTIHAWGDNSAGQSALPPSVNSVAAVAAGVEHSVALRRNGTVVAWGGNTFGQSRVPSSLTNAGAAVAAIAAGSFHNMALRSNGTVVAWGKGTFGATNVPPNATNVTTIAAGGEHCLALRSDGVIVAWGYNNWGQIEVPGNLASVAAIAAGGDRSLALRRSGLRFDLPLLLPSGSVRFSFRNLDGSAITSNRLANSDVYASTNAALPFANWTKLTTALVISNGGVQFDDPPVAGRPQRFYRVAERQ